MEAAPLPLVLRDTLLSRRPNPIAPFAMALTTLGVVLLSILAWKNIGGAEAWMQANRDEAFTQHQYWKAWTTLFVHGDGKHLLSNSFLFFILGTFLTGYFGILRVLLAAFFCGGLTNLMVLQTMPPESHLIGLSGVVFWMGGAWLILYVLIDRKRRLMNRILRAGGVGLVLFMPAEAFDPSVSYESHLIGFFLGIIAGLLYFSFYKRSLREAEVYEAGPLDEEDAAVTRI